MKKLMLILSLLTIFNLSLFAANNNANAEKDESKWTTLSYTNIPILKVLEGKNGYVVIYQKNKVGTGTVVIPKDWAQGSQDNPRKLSFRKVRRSMDCYMTVQKKDGEFKKVVLNLPMNKQNTIWGVVKGKGELDGCDKDVLEEIEL